MEVNIGSFDFSSVACMFYMCSSLKEFVYPRKWKGPLSDDSVCYNCVFAQCEQLEVRSVKSFDEFKNFIIKHGSEFKRKASVPTKTPPHKDMDKGCCW